MNEIFVLDDAGVYQTANQNYILNAVCGFQTESAGKMKSVEIFTLQC